MVSDQCGKEREARNAHPEACEEEQDTIAPRIGIAAKEGSEGRQYAYEERRVMPSAEGVLATLPRSNELLQLFVFGSQCWGCERSRGLIDVFATTLSIVKVSRRGAA